MKSLYCIHCTSKHLLFFRSSASNINKNVSTEGVMRPDDEVGTLTVIHFIYFSLVALTRTSQAAGVGGTIFIECERE
jgi:hypothetical protein